MAKTAKTKHNPKKFQAEKRSQDTPIKEKGIVKRKPVKKSVIAANSNARKALGTGEVDAAELKRRQEQDARTLYIRFTGESLPSSHDEIKALHSDIKFVRTPRTTGKDKGSFKYAFLEFTSEEESVEAKNKLATTRFNGAELYVDYVGAKSKSAKKEEKDHRLNPCRLFVCGLAPGVTKGALKEMFPKCSGAEIPATSVKKGTPFGFVQFSNPGDAKSAFDAAQNLDIAGHKITVLYAKITEDKEQIQERKQKKRKKLEEKKKAKKAKLEAEKSTAESDSDEEDEEEEVEFKQVAKKTKESSKATEENDDTEEEEMAGEEENDKSDEEDDVKDGEEEGENGDENDESDEEEDEATKEEENDDDDDDEDDDDEDDDNDDEDDDNEDKNEEDDDDDDEDDDE